MSTTDDRRLSWKKTGLIAGSILAAAAIVPAAAMASTGTLINIADPVNGADQARVTAGRIAVNSLDVNSTALLYRTPAGAESLAAGTSKNLANISTASYRHLRIVADERTGSVSNVSF